MNRDRIRFALLLSAGMSYALSQTLIIPALPKLADDAGASPAAASWLMTGYLLSASVATPLVGKLGDLHGRGRVLTWVMAIFIAGSALCAVTHSLPLLITGRVMQGISGGVFPLAYGVIRDTFPADRRMAAVGTLSISLGAGSALGPPLSGIAVEHLGLHSIFWIALAGAVPGLLGARLIPERPAGTARRLDLRGAVILAGLLMCLLLALTQGNQWGWESPGIAALFAGFAGLLWLWIRVERDSSEPLIAVGLLRTRSMALVNLAAIGSGLGIFTSFIPLAAFIQAPESTGYGFALSSSAAGLLLMPHGLAIVLFGRAAGAMCRRVGPRAAIACGAVVNTAASLQLVFAHQTAFLLGLGSTVLGVGQALLLAGLANLVVAEVPQAVVGIATGLNTIMRTIGQAVGSALAGAVLAASVMGGTHLAGESGYVAAYAISAGAWMISLLAAAAMPRSPRVAPGLAPVTP